MYPSIVIVSTIAATPAQPATINAPLVLPPDERIILEYTQALHPAPSKNPMSKFDAICLIVYCMRSISAIAARAS